MAWLRQDRLAFAFLPGLVLAGTARAESLQEALSLAYETNPQLQAARAQLRQTDEGVPQAVAGWRPHVTVHAEAGSAVRNNTIDPRVMPEHLTPQDYEADLTQNLYTSGRVLSQVKQAREQVEMGRATLAAVEDDVLLAAATAFADVVRDRAIVALEAKQVAVLEHTVQASTVEVAAGEITEADRDEADARLANQRAIEAAAVATEQGSEARYEQQVGAVPGGDLTLPAQPLPAPEDEAEAIAEALAANPALIAARDAVAVSRLGVDLQIDELLPNIALHGIVERLREYEYESHAQRADEAQLTVVLTMPLYQGGLLYSRIRAAKESNVQMQALEDQQRRQARATTIEAWASLQAARIRLEQSETATRADRVAETGIAQQQGVGARTVIDVLIAEQDELTSEVAEVTARHDLVTSSLALLAVTGRLDYAHLDLLGPRYDPQAHFRTVRERWAGTAPPATALLEPRGPIVLPPP